jgi:diguanylate cyclase (GGDEF)-like protein
MTLQPDALQQQLDAALKEYGVTPAFDTPLRSGKFIRSRSFVVPDAAGDRYIGRIWMYEDVTVEHARLREAQERAERDALTGLHNRRRFEEDLERSFAQAQRSGSRLSLLYFDLDDFKNINDTHGHATGDKIVKGVAQALMLQARRNESLYHVGGDQFAIMSADSEQRQIETMAQRVIATVGQVRLNVADFQIHISCSVGIAMCAQGERPNNAEELLRQAELAMYQAKHIGKNRWQLYDPALILDLGEDSR